MKKSENLLLKDKFSHIYVEKDTLNYELTQKIISKYKRSEIILIDHYKDVFNKKRQMFFIQKKSQKLILAKKREPYLYKGSVMCDSFGHDNFYYTSNAMNCIYNCEYCYLQGLYDSGNQILFVNLEDTFNSIEKMHSADKTYICISYDTDLLAMEHLTGFVKKWVEFSLAHPGIVIELRTKSANFSLIEKLEPSKQFILAWSILPDEIISQYEEFTPALAGRLDNIKRALQRGWEVRLCIDPVIYTDNFDIIYAKMAAKVKEKIDLKLLSGISTGVFRVPKESLKRMRRNNPESTLLSYPFEYDKETGSYTYSDEMKNKMISYVSGLFN